MGDTGEKTEEATPEKLRKAKREGQVPKSQDLVGALGFVAGFFALVAALDFVFSEIRDFTARALEGATRDPSIATLINLLEDTIPLILRVTLPISIAVFVMGIFSNTMQTGLFFAFKAIIPKMDKINPANGLKNLFKVKKLVELLKNILKMALAAWLAWSVMSAALYEMTLLVSQPLAISADFASRLLGEYLIKTTVLFIMIATVDLIYSRKTFKKEMMMSKYDVKQEYKQQEGDPQMKGQRRQLAQELLLGGGSQNVKKADAVVVNPAHIAVAIQYEGDEGAAPKVVAKGMRIHAERIKELAKYYGIPIMRNVPLAQALYKLDLEEEIPEELYEAVAEVLAFVYKLKEQQEQKRKDRREDAARQRAHQRPSSPAQRLDDQSKKLLKKKGDA